MLKPFSSEQYQKRTATGYSGDECCLCGRQTAGLDGAIHVPVDHTQGEFVTADEMLRLPDDNVSMYPIGPECVKKWRKEFDAEAVRLHKQH